MRRIFFRRRGTTRKRFTIAILAIGGPLLAIQLIGVIQSRIDSRVEIVNADTLRVGGTLVRLFGVDAPAKPQTCHNATGATYDCGRRAADFVRAFVRGKAVSCTRGRSDATVVCYANGRDLGAALIHAGWAVQAPGTLTYRAEEAAARRAGRGMWSGSFERPARWRQRETSADSKGNSS